MYRNTYYDISIDGIPPRGSSNPAVRASRRPARGRGTLIFQRQLQEWRVWVGEGPSGVGIHISIDGIPARGSSSPEAQASRRPARGRGLCVKLHARSRAC